MCVVFDGNANYHGVSLNNVLLPGPELVNSLLEVLAPLETTSILRLELCVTVLAVESVDVITDELDIELNPITFDTDSRVVLAYMFKQRISTILCVCGQTCSKYPQKYITFSIELRHNRH